MRLALIVEDEAGSVARYSFADLRAASNRLANALAAAGLVAGDRVAILLAPGAGDRRRPSRRLPLGADRGPAVRPVRTGRARVPAVATRARPRSSPMPPTGPRSPRSASACRTCGRSSSSAAAGSTGRSTTTPRVAAGVDRRSATVDTSAEDPAIIIYTSGTTGPPKGALHAHRFLLGHLPGVAAAAGVPTAARRPVLDARRLGVDRRAVRRPLPGLALGPAGAGPSRPPVRARPRARPDGAPRRPQRLPAADRPQADPSARRARPPGDLALRSVASGGETLGGELLGWGQRDVRGLDQRVLRPDGVQPRGRQQRRPDGRPAGLDGPAGPGHEVAVIDAEGADARTGRRSARSPSGDPTR